MEVDPLSTECLIFESIEYGKDNVEDISNAVIKEEETGFDYVEKPQQSDETSRLVKVETLATTLIVSPVVDSTTLDSTEQKEPKIKVKKEKKKEKKLKDKKSKVKIEKQPKKRQRRIANYEMPEEIPGAIPFYGCSVCDTKYTSLQALQYHVTQHKDRLTSWDLRVKNQQIKKKLKKEKKRLKKLKDGVKEEEVKVKEEVELPVDLEEFVENLANNTNESADLLTNNQIPASFNNQNDTTENAAQNSETNDNVTSDNQNHSSENVNNCNNNETEENGEVNNTQDQSLNLEKIFKCGLCLKQFSLGYYLKLHVRSHTGEKPYHCDQCGISFITASKLGRHRKRAHLAVRFECRICHRTYTRLEFLTRHFNKHHAEDKIEGEPYDYNAILPYLKELEEELQRKKEEEMKQKQETKDEFFPFLDSKPSTEELWPLCPETVKQEIEVKPEIKQECDVQDDVMDVGADDFHDSFPEEDLAPLPMKNEDQSDEDYFPEDTWLPPVSPKIEVSDLKPLKSKNKRLGSNGALQCEICEKSIKSQSYMRIHLRTHSGDRPYKCYVCNKGFITASKMNRHVMTHGMDWDSEKQKEADESAMKNEAEDAEADGVKDENNPKERKKRKPGRKRSKVPIPPKHKPEYINGEKVNRRKQKRPHACEFCYKRFLYVEALQIHMHVHNGEQKSYVCNFCLDKFDDEESLKTHEVCHGGPQPYLCTICGRAYKKKESMVYHRRMHDSDKKFQCDVCPKSFNAQCKLQRHLMSHRPDKYVVRYECPVCAHMFNTKYHVEMHLSTHEKEGVILQENRGQVLAMVMQNARKIPLENDSPSSQKNLIPSDERSRICNICGEIFNHFYYLEQHLKTHGSKFSIETQQEVEEKKYICQVCNKGFKLSYYLKLHSFTHTKEKPYICQQCGKGFITKGKLKRHLETHAGLKKYQCHICCKFFTRPSYLRIHVRTIHGNQDYNFKADMDYDMGMPMVDNCGMSMTHDSV